jgi:hypothetical protein
MSIERLLEASRAFDRGDLDAAEQVYLAVAEVDPRSTIAVMGLARVAMARGGDANLALAERLASTVLAHDPENAAAGRLHDEWRARTAPRPPAFTPEQAPIADDGDAPGSPGAGPAPAAGAAAPEASKPVGQDQARDEDEFPWPDLDEQLDRYREHAPGPLGRLLRRGRG